MGRYCRRKAFMDSSEESRALLDQHCAGFKRSGATSGIANARTLSCLRNLHASLLACATGPRVILLRSRNRNANYSQLGSAALLPPLKKVRLSFLYPQLCELAR